MSARDDADLRPGEIAQNTGEEVHVFVTDSRAADPHLPLRTPHAVPPVFWEKLASTESR